MEQWQAVESPLGADYEWSVESPNGVVAWVAGIGDAEAVANAKMFAAAPKMLKALKDLREAATEAYKAGRVDALAFVTAGNVIAEAEGR